MCTFAAMRNSSRIILLALLVLSACRPVPRFADGSRVLAEAGGRKLYTRDLTPIVPRGMSRVDSAAFVRQYVERWVRRQLKLRQAEKMFSSSQRDIDSLVEQYREGLLIRKFDQQLVERTDTTITAEQVEAYHRDHAADFQLAQTIVRGRIVRLPSGSRQGARVRALLGLNTETSRQDLADLCAKNQFDLADFSDRWVTWTEYLSLLPTLRTRTYDQILHAGDVQQMRDGQSDYLFSLSDILREGQTEPLSRAMQTARTIIANKRQTEAVERYDAQSYRKALKEGDAEIFLEP